MAKAKKPNWQSSPGKQILIKALRLGSIPMSAGDIDLIYALHTEFGGDNPNEFRLFPNRLKSARKFVEQGLQRALSEVAAFEHDRQFYAISQVNQRNEPRWQGSQAETLLKADIDSGKHEAMKPIVLHKSNWEYQKFPLHVFRGHIYQEVKLRKFINQYGSRNKIRHQV